MFLSLFCLRFKQMPNTVIFLFSFSLETEFDKSYKVSPCKATWTCSCLRKDSLKVLTSTELHLHITREHGNKKNTEQLKTMVNNYQYILLNLLHSEWPKLHWVLAILSAIKLIQDKRWDSVNWSNWLLRQYVLTSTHPCGYRGPS